MKKKLLYNAKIIYFRIQDEFCDALLCDIQDLCASVDNLRVT